MEENRVNSGGGEGERGVRIYCGYCFQVETKLDYFFLLVYMMAVVSTAGGPSQAPHELTLKHKYK